MFNMNPPIWTSSIQSSLSEMNSEILETFSNMKIQIRLHKDFGSIVYGLVTTLGIPVIERRENCQIIHMRDI